MWHFIVLVLIVVSPFHVYADNPSCSENSCMAVVDAGSTGSRVHIYSFDREGNDPKNIKEIDSKKIQPGLSSVALNQSAINQYLSSLFDKNPGAHIPVYIYATAGMRLLPHPKQQAYYEMVQHWFADQSQWTLIEAKTITGKEEGIYGWLGVNYALGRLTQEEGDAPVGVMDTGGASVQVTFTISNPQEVNNDDQAEIDLYGHHYHLFVHSFLGLGQNEVDHQFLDAADCFPNQYPLTNGLLAQGDFSLCEKQITPLINAVHKVDQIVQPILFSNPVKTWYGIGGIGYIVQTPPMTFENNEFKMKQMEEKANDVFCKQDWSDISKKYPKNDYLYSSCLNASYFYSLFVDGYGINPDQTIHYFLSSQNSGDWTLGVVLHH